MSAGEYDFLVEKGTDFDLPLRVKFESGEARDFTGYTARMHVRELPSAPETLDELTTENGRITICSDGGALDPVKDHIILRWSNAVSSQMLSGNHYYDLEVVSPEGTVERLLQGRIKFVEEVTR